MIISPTHWYKNIDASDIQRAVQLAEKAEKMAAHVIVGETMRVRSSTDKRFTTVGKIKSAEVNRIRYTKSGKSLQAVFKVTLICGINQVERDVFVTRIPC